MPRRLPPMVNNGMMQERHNNTIPPPNNQTEREPTLKELIMEVQNMADNGDEDARIALQRIGERDGTTTDSDNG
ncbi:MAG: hypothetical protein IJ590_04460, partial [Rickettsiales bacterium]|nr:hypothetical protein [Rickettsiales bacterium]